VSREDDMYWLVESDRVGELHVLPAENKRVFSHTLSEDCKCGVSMQYTDHGERMYVSASEVAGNSDITNSDIIIR
jgi:hypothetical protein